ncbi:MAG TPA: signal recognition particle-docking protein FtsY, partial [Methanobacterium sp.]
SGLLSFVRHKTISEKDVDDILFELEMSLLEGDVALEVAEEIINSVKEDLVGRKIKRRSDVSEFTKEALKKAISKILEVDSHDIDELIALKRKEGEPLKIMFVGINGTGKTTTIAKVATYFIDKGYKPVMAASDTFRAGAIEQLTHHADKIGVKIIKHKKGADPAAVAFDAVEHAKAQGKELVLVDTAGRMQTNVNLMDEMKKIQRVIKPDLILFVGDALTGNDAVEQARKFDDAVGVDGIVLTKADADAKGGAALSIGHVINKPILFLGTGQSYSDIMEFKPDWMVEQVFGESN